MPPSTPPSPHFDPLQPDPLQPESPEPRPQSSEAAPQRSGSSDAPVSFIPHTTTGAVGNEPMRIRAGRYGDLEAHEIIHLLGSIEDERARGRFRESIYLSVFIWLAVAWFVFYGPRVLWHAPQLKLASDAIREQQLVRLTTPVGITKFETKTDKGTPRQAPNPQHQPVHQAMDAKTLGQIREMARVTPAPTPPPMATSAPPPTMAAPNVEAPNAMAHTNTRAPMPSNIPDAPAPQPSSRESIRAGNGNPNDSMSEIARGSRGSGGNPGGITTMPARGGANVGAGSEILSDTEGVDFGAWGRKLDRGTLSAWGPLLPEEIQPPLSKKGMTTLVVTILSDGTIADMKIEGSTHDTALDRAAWGSIISQGKLPELPHGFKGKQIIVRLRYYVNMDR